MEGNYLGFAPKALIARVNAGRSITENVSPIKKKILLLDKNKSFSAALKKTIETLLPCEVDSISEPKEDDKEIDKTRYAVIMEDSGFPYDAKMHKEKTAPIVMYAMEVTDKLKEFAEKNGIDEVVAKTSLPELAKVIGKYLK